jgi:hypothetical protein
MLFLLFFTFYCSRPRFEEARGPRYRVLAQGYDSSGSVVVVAMHSLCGCSNRGALALQRDLLRRSENPPILQQYIDLLSFKPSATMEAHERSKN